MTALCILFFATLGAKRCILGPSDLRLSVLSHCTFAETSRMHVILATSKQNYK